jgi:hypothetical protein
MNNIICKYYITKWLIILHERQDKINAQKP